MACLVGGELVTRGGPELPSKSIPGNWASGVRGSRKLGRPKELKFFLDRQSNKSIFTYIPDVCSEAERR